MEPKAQVFDVAGALKEFPESEVAAHVAQLHGVDRDAYLKEGLTDADFLKEYGGRDLPAPVSSGAATDPMASRNDPLNTSAAGAIAGGTGSVGKIAFNRMFPNQPVPAAPPPTPEPEPYIHGGQRYKAKTGFGAGEGESVREVSDEWKRIEAEKNKPAGRGKVSSKVTGGSPDEILARAKAEEAELANQARIRAQIKMAEEAKRKAAFDAAEAQRKAIEAERKFAVPNRIGKSLPVTGATVGYNLADVNQQLKQDDPVQAAIAGAGVVGAAAPYIKKLPPKLRAIGTGLSLLAPVVNRGIDAVEEKAAGGLTGYATGGGPKLPGKLGAAQKAVNLAQKAAHELHGQTPGRMTDFLQHHIGKFVVPTQSDRMGGVGGPSFSANSLVLPHYKGHPWGSGNEGTATAITNLAKDERFGGPENQIFVPLLGHQNQHKSNQIVFDKLMQEFYSHPEKLTPELRAKINAFMQSGGGIEKATGQPYFSPFADFDIADKDMVGLLGRSFDNRGLIAQHAFGGVRLDGKKSQIFPYQQRLDEMADPTVAGAPTFAVGPRAFQLSGEVHPEARPDLNPAFPYLLGGHDLNVAYNPVPNKTIFQDFQNQWRAHKGKTTPLKSGELPQPGYYENTIGYKVNPEDAERIYPRQEVTEQLLDSMYKEGHAAGGTIQGYSDGKSVLPNVSLDARSMPSISGMPGVGYMQTPQGALARLQLEKELEDARIRAGVSGMAMAIPGQQGVKTVPGQMDIGANIPVGPGNLDISANRSINPIPGRGHIQGINARYTMPFATGGGVQHFANGRLALAERIGKGTLDLLGKSKEEILAARKLLPKHPQQQNPELAKAVDALRTGQISQKEYLDIAARLYRPNILGKVPDKLSPEEIAVAIGPGKASKGIVGYNVELPKGATYESRLDIPGYTDTGRSVSSIELPSGKMVYGQAEHMGQSDLISDPTKGMRVALGTKEQAMTPGALEYGAPKSPFAVVKGPHLETDPDEIRRMMEFYSGDPKWRELGMNPYSHSQFFDKKTMQPAWNADEVLKYGQYVLGKEPELTHWLDPRLAVDAEKVGGVPGIKFKKGGLATLKKKK